jgi:methyl halide transferase
MMPLDHTPGRLQGHFAGHSLPEHTKLWNSLYEESFTPWDRGQPSLALYDLLVEHPDLVARENLMGHRTRTALVPGCGRGWDVLLLAAYGFRAIGLDTSELAIEQAKKLHKAVASGEARMDEEYAAALQPRNGVASLAEDDAITWTTGDFFKDDWLREARSEKFDLIFDYTVGILRSTHQLDRAHI